MVLGFVHGDRAHHIWGLFKGLQVQIQTPKERLQLLLRLKHFAGCLDCPLAADLIALIEREADLRSRWVSTEPRLVNHVLKVASVSPITNPCPAGKPFAHVLARLRSRTSGLPSSSWAVCWKLTALTLAFE